MPVDRLYDGSTGSREGKGTMPKTSRKRTGRGKKTSGAKRAPRRALAEIDHERHVDGCDADFTASAPTADADLPPAKGGIEIVGAKRRRVR